MRPCLRAKQNIHIYVHAIIHTYANMYTHTYIKEAKHLICMFESIGVVRGRKKGFGEWIFHSLHSCFVSLISVKYWRFLSENGFPLYHLLNFLSCLKMFLGSVKELVVCFINFIVLSVTKCLHWSRILRSLTERALCSVKFSVVRAPTGKTTISDVFSFTLFLVPVDFDTTIVRLKL